jgi:hypothetical protein
MPLMLRNHKGVVKVLSSILRNQQDIALSATKPITQLTFVIKSMVIPAFPSSNLKLMLLLMMVLMRVAQWIMVWRFPLVLVMVCLKSNILNLYPCCNKQIWFLQHLFLQATPLISTSFSASPLVNAGISSLPNYWLLDSGANEHLCCNLSYFTSFHRIKPVCVTLPNKTTILVHYAGNVSFTPQFYLTNVLYSPLCQLNLISVAKLCESLSCVLHFSHDQCMIQDQTSMKMIGLARQVHGLYRYSPAPDACSSNFMLSRNKACISSFSVDCHSSNCIPASALWHFKLGHLSHQRMTKMSDLYPSIVHNNKDVCDICHFSKQKHLPFSSSLSHASTNFELLHFDIWGPISISSVHGHKYFLTIVDDHSKFLWTILLKSKSEVSHHVKHFITMLLMAFFIKGHVLRLLNKMVVLKGNINTSLTLVEPYYFNLNFHLPFGPMLFCMLFFS